LAGVAVIRRIQANAWFKSSFAVGGRKKMKAGFLVAMTMEKRKQLLPLINRSDILFNNLIE